MQEKPASKSSNFVLFIVLTFGVLMLHGWWLQQRHPKPQANQQAAGAKDEPGGKAEPDKNKPVADKPDVDKPGVAKPQGDEPDADKPNADQPEDDAPEGDVPEDDAPELQAEEEPAAELGEDEAKQPAAGGEVPKITGPARWYTIGSADPNDPYRMLVTLTDRGAAVARIELNSPRYPALMDDDGFIGPEEGFWPIPGAIWAGLPSTRKKLARAARSKSSVAERRPIGQGSSRAT